jgi:hypothetical protein
VFTEAQQKRATQHEVCSPEINRSVQRNMKYYTPKKDRSAQRNVKFGHRRKTEARNVT